MILFRRFDVPPNHRGFLFNRYRLQETFEPGIYHRWDWQDQCKLFNLPLTPRLLEVSNQEVLSKDQIAFRLSFIVEFRVSDPDTFIKKFDLFPANAGQSSWDVKGALPDAEKLVHSLAQIQVRDVLSQLASSEVSEKRTELIGEVPESLQQTLAAYGLKIEKLLLKDLTFPKAIQDLFARKLEATIRSQSDLENARTAVATARALKNAAELIKGDSDIRYLQYLETLTKIAAKGKHTFVLGEPAGKNVTAL